MIDVVLRVLGLRPLTEGLRLLREVKTGKVRVVLERGDGAEELEVYADLLYRASKGRIVYTAKPSGKPYPCLTVTDGEKKLSYCGSIDEALFAVIVEAILVLGEAVRVECPGDMPDKLRLRLFVVSGAPCLVTGFTVARLLACLQAADIEIVEATTYNSLNPSRPVKKVPLIIISGRVYNAVLRTPRDLVELLPGAPSGRKGEVRHSARKSS